MNRYYPLLCAAAIWLGSTAASAQTATLEGRVTDAQGAALVEASVTVSSVASSFTEVTVTDETGAFRVDSITPGVYEVSVGLLGFRTFEETVSLEAGESRSLEVRLVLARFVQRVDVVAVSPVQGSGVDRSRIPTAVSVLEADELSRRQAVSLADALQERLGSVTLEDSTANPFQPSLRFRGFTASPLLGLPQGIAVYQNGVRINEPFGDTVQFDLIPQFALANAQLSAGADPTFGLNALGGALALRLENGFDAPGLRGEIFGGSFDRVTGTAELGASRGPWAFYTGATRFTESGWRQESDSDVTQAVADVTYRNARVDAGVSFTYADTRLNGNGPAPVELLEVDRTAVFTHPDTTENELAFFQGRFHVALSSVWSLQLTGFYRDLDRRTLNGDEAELDVCDSDILPMGAPANTLCVGDSDLVVDVASGRFITEDDTRGNGAFNRTVTGTTGYGGSIQAVATAPLAGRDNVFVVGASLDLADVEFTSHSEVGTLTPSRTVDGSGLLAGIFMQAPDDRFNTSLETDDRAIGLYFTDTLSVSDRFHVTVSGRYNDARTIIRDRLGTSLNGEHRFTRFNPGVGAVFEISPALSVFGRYTESNRAPTAAELSCADPDEPCRVPNAFVSDPPLEQAVARSVEGGARGSKWGKLDWSVTAYRTKIRDDILFVASPELIGTGFFQNAGDTRRAGLDADVAGTSGRLDWYASYGLVDATFQSSLSLPSDDEVNDAANPGGELEVEPGDRMPGIPRHSFKVGGEYAVTPQWDVALDGILSSSRIFVGDEGNDQEPLEGYGIVHFRTAYRVGENIELFARVHNVFDAEYATFGVLAEVELELDEAPGAEIPRFVSPGAPRSLFAGVRVEF